jgi:hypothetical protein
MLKYAMETNPKFKKFEGKLHTTSSLVTLLNSLVSVENYKIYHCLFQAKTDEEREGDPGLGLYRSLMTLPVGRLNYQPAKRQAYFVEEKLGNRRYEISLGEDKYYDHRYFGDVSSGYLLVQELKADTPLEKISRLGFEDISGRLRYFSIRDQAGVIIFGETKGLIRDIAHLLVSPPKTPRV